MLNDQRIRQTLGLFAVISLAVTFYASAIPLELRPASLIEVWERFQRTPWLSLGLEKRADWVANGLVLVPFGFFFTGAWQWPESSFRRKQLVLIGFAVLQIVIVSAIEAMQVWFPPRVRSINDMTAGFVGGMLGVLLWNLIGKQIIETARDFRLLERGFPRIASIAKIAAITLVLYGLIPFDVMLTPSEWAAKYAIGRFNWIPMADVQGLGEFAKKCLLGSWAFALGVVLAKQSPGRVARRKILLWCLLIEFVSLPIYGRETSVTGLLFSGIWGILGVQFSELTFIVCSRLNRAGVWLTAAAAWSVTAFIGFVHRFHHIVTDYNLIMDRMKAIWAVPFARAQRSTEFQAIENISLKLATFLLLGFFLSGWLARLRLADRARLVVIAIWTLLLACAIEVSQVFLPPLIADITDIILYGVGTLLGVMLYRLLLPRNAPSTTNKNAGSS